MELNLSAGEWTVAAAYAVVIAVAAYRHVLIDRALRRVPRLAPESPAAPAADRVVSVLVPAKDEAHGIADCLRSVLAQRYGRLEVLLVDDRSTDGTAEIAEGLARDDARLRVLRVAELPAGWTGKTHALDVGQRQAAGEWLLFVDADTTLHPDAVAVCVAHAEAAGVDLLSLMPGLDMRTFWERAVQPFAGVCLTVFFPLDRVNDPAAAAYGFANGQFILIRRAAYDRLGGHAAVRDKFVEDIALGRRARRAGVPLAVGLGPGLLRVRMYAGLGQIVRGWSRIFYSAVDARPWPLVVLMLSIGVFSLVPYGLLTVGAAAWAAGLAPPLVKLLVPLAVAHEVVQFSVMYRLYRLSASPVSSLFLRPLGVAVMLVILLRTLRLCVTHDVVWRGTSYRDRLRDGATTPGA